MGHAVQGESRGGVDGVAGAEDRLTGDRTVGAPQADPVDEHRRRRRRAEAAAEAAEAAAADAAARASAAIAAASRAAADAEAAAEAAARAADEVEEAVAAERAALAGEPPPLAPPPGYPQQPVSRHGTAPPLFVPVERPVADAETVALPVTQPDPDDAVTPATGGRASLRQERDAAPEAAREPTRDPETPVDPPGPGDGAGPVQRVIRSFRAQLDLRAVLTAAAVGTVLLVAGVLASVLGGPTGPSPMSAAAAGPTAASAPAAATPVPPASAPTAAAPTDAPSDAPVDPASPKAVAYLAALRAAGVPTSDSGESEVQAGAVICQQLAKGTDAAELVQALPAVLPSVNSRQAKSMVTLAQQKYC
jgi:hypothetical protein